MESKHTFVHAAGLSMSVHGRNGEDVNKHSSNDANLVHAADAILGDLLLQCEHPIIPLDSAQKIALLHEARKPQYKDKMISVAIAITKKQIAASVNEDTSIIQAINAIEDLDKICNSLAKRTREWYGYYFPELSNKIEDHALFLNRLIEKPKEELMKEYAIEESMGPDISETNFAAIIAFAMQARDLFIERERLVQYLEKLMQMHCKNVYALTGALIGAKLIERAGSLRQLAFMPSSTIQLLGAEKALFRHLRNRRIRPPKHGYILSHPYVMDATRDKRGMRARIFAAKICIAAKTDYFRGEFIGDKLKEDLEKRK